MLAGGVKCRAVKTKKKKREKSIPAAQVPSLATSPSVCFCYRKENKRRFKAAAGGGDSPNPRLTRETGDGVGGERGGP